MKIGNAFHPRDIQLADWHEFVKQIGGSEKAVISPLREMAEAIPTAARIVANELETRYGKCAIYSTIVEKIVNRAAAIIRSTDE